MIQQGELTVLRLANFGFQGVCMGQCYYRHLPPRVVSLHLLRQALPGFGYSTGWSGLLLEGLVCMFCNLVQVVQHLTCVLVEHSI